MVIAFINMKCVVVRAVRFSTHTSMGLHPATWNRCRLHKRNTAGCHAATRPAAPLDLVRSRAWLIVCQDEPCPWQASDCHSHRRCLTAARTWHQGSAERLTLCARRRVSVPEREEAVGLLGAQSGGGSPVATRAHAKEHSAVSVAALPDDQTKLMLEEPGSDVRSRRPPILLYHPDHPDLDPDPNPNYPQP